MILDQARNIISHVLIVGSLSMMVIVIGVTLVWLVTGAKL